MNSNDNWVKSNEEGVNSKVINNIVNDDKVNSNKAKEKLNQYTVKLYDDRVKSYQDKLKLSSDRVEWNPSMVNNIFEILFIT